MNMAARRNPFLQEMASEMNSNGKSAVAIPCRRKKRCACEQTTRRR
jgi:hypothetical protein